MTTKHFDDGKNDIYVGEPDGAHILINEAMILSMGTTYEAVSKSPTEIAVFLQAVVLKLCKQISDKKTAELVGTEKDYMTVRADYEESPYKLFNTYFQDHRQHWLNELGQDRYLALFDYCTKHGAIWSE